MALPTQLIDLPFTQGVDTKTNPQLSAKPAAVENMVLVGGTFQKKPGSTPLAPALDTGGWLLYGGALFQFDAEMVRFGNGLAYSFGTQQNDWTTKAGRADVCLHSVKEIVHKSSSQDDFSHAYNNGITVTAWVDSGVHISVYDEATGEFYQAGATAVSGTSGYKGTCCVAVGKSILVFYCHLETALYCSVIDTTSPETTPTKITLETDFTGDDTYGRSFDAMAFGGHAIVAYISGVTESLHLQLIAVDGTGAVMSSPAKTDRGAVLNTGVKMHIDLNNVGYVFNYSGAVDYLAFNTSTFAQVLARTVIDNSLTYDQELCATAELSAGSVTAMFSSLGATVQGSFADIFMSRAVVTSAGVTTAIAPIPGTAGLAIQGDGVVVNGTACCLVMNDATVSGDISLQPTGWIVSSTGNVAAKFFPGTAANQQGGRCVRPFTAPSGATAYLLSQQGQTSYTSQSGNIISTTPRGISRIDLAVDTSSEVPCLRLGEAVYVGGSQPRMYDGQEAVEAGPNNFPENVSVSLGSSGALSAGSYQWRVVYTWISARGELQRSVPSPAVSATATSTQKATLTIPTQRLSGRDIAGISTTQIEVYRTEANGQLFYRLSSVTAPTLNNNAAASITYQDSTVSDADLITNELLYTTGGVSDSVAPPGYQIACEHKTRLCVALMDDAYAWQSSAAAISGQMLRFNESWGGRVPASTGPITAMASMDGNLIIFTTQAAYIVPGDGPDLLGNNNWPAPQRITSVDSGAISWQSVVSTPTGVFFQNSRGYHLLDRGLACEYVGAPVEKYAALTARCALAIPAIQQVRFEVGGWPGLLGQLDCGWVTGPGGYCLVYDYFYRQWSVWKNSQNLTTCLYQGKYTFMGIDAIVRQEQPGTWGDVGLNRQQVPQVGGNGIVAPSSMLETPWIKVGGIQGFQRVKRAILLGQFGSNCTITCEVAYDYDPSFTDAVVVSGNDVAPFGAMLQFRWVLARQKCEAVKFRFRDSSIGGNGAGMALTGLSLEVGVKGGVFRLSPGRSA